MSSYSAFAEVYDRLMGDVDYAGYAETLKRLFLKYDRMPTLLLDLACGTGGFSNEFASDGVDVIGVDPSEEMLASAREKSACRGNNILYLCQKAQELDLFGTVDGAICCLDSLNHITDYDALCRAVARISLFLERGRLFIFDVNTVYKHEQILADRTFVIEQNGIFCVWQNEYDSKTRTTDICLDFFAEENGRYSRSSEDFSERAYTPEELEGALNAAGLELLAVYAGFSEQELRPDSERALYITRKTG